MKKGIVMEVNDIYSIVLNDSGLMEKISSKPGLAVGQKIFYFEEDIIKTKVTNEEEIGEIPVKDNIIMLDESKKKRNKANMFIKTFSSIAALFLIIFTLFHNSFMPEKAYAVVTLDINPSIQMEVSSNKKILSIEGVNDDGKNLNLEEIKGMDIEDGINAIKKKLVENNYLEENHDVLVAFALVKDDINDSSDYEEQIIDTIKTTFKSENIAYVKGTKKAVEEAKTQGISLGRYEASLSVDEEIKNNIKEVPVKEITSIIKDKQNCVYWEAEKQDDTDDSSDKAENNNSSVIEAVESNNTVQDDSSIKNNTNVDQSINKNEEVSNSESEGSVSGEINKSEVITDSNNGENTSGQESAGETDEDIIEVEPEIQIPNQQVEVTEDNAGKGDVIVSPEKDKMENNIPSSKFEDEEIIEVQPEKAESSTEQ